MLLKQNQIGTTHPKSKKLTFDRIVSNLVDVCVLSKGCSRGCSPHASCVYLLYSQSGHQCHAWWRKNPMVRLWCAPFQLCARVALWSLQSGSLFYLRRLLLLKIGMCALWLSPKWQPAAFSQSCCVSKMIVPFKKIKLVSSMVHAILKRCNPVLWGDKKIKKSPFVWCIQLEFFH